jgi:adenylate kinase
LQVEKKIFPDFVFHLEADDDFLRKRVLNMPERAVSGTHHNESGKL